ncbi:cinnamyl-alcohol dehydrogenase [Perilla frutescens var. frutescens]|nr:cinnamyl-alcohol dehydrogenase [Perilla frutescens var. frutescens]
MAAANGECLGWAARDPSGTLSPYKFTRRSVGSDDVSIAILYCGVCYADVAWTRNKMGHSNYPLVPGHEIVGIVTEVGANVDRFKVGEHIGVGTYVNSCRDCEFCNSEVEVHCSKGSTYTFDGVDVDGTITKGGYSTYIVVHQRYCFRIPENYPPELAAPLLCAGITVYTPMVRHNMNRPGKSLGVVGLGGLGFPNEVKFLPGSLNLGSKIVAGSLTGGTKQTQEMLGFCAEHKIYPEIELIPIQYCNEAIERVVKKDVKYRFVIDIANSLK